MTNEEKAKSLARQIYEEIGLSQHSIERVAEIICEGLDEKDRQFREDVECICDVHNR